MNRKKKQKAKKSDTRVKTVINENRDVFLFPYKVKRVVSTLSQTQGWQIKQLNVPETWKVTKGEGIKVMVVDTGYTDHPDLQGGILVSECKSFLKREPSIEDAQGHSSHVCGIIGARNNEIGMVGVAPECTIITAKVLGADGSGDFESIRAALVYAKQVRPHVINMSLGSHGNDPRLHQIIKELHAMNIPVIAAAGNDSKGNSVNYPGKYPEVICVTAFDKDGKPARFNSTGPEADFSAPGVDIYSTWLNHEYVQLSGTSMATPFIAGLVALLIAKHNKQELETGQNDCKTVEQIREHLIKYADDKGVVGKDDTWGYGVINPEKIIASDSGTSPQPPPPPVINLPEKKGWWQRLKKKIQWIF